LANKIILKDVNAAYGAVQVLHGVSMEVSYGETVALLGTNGNGKSTLIKCVAGLVRPTGGIAQVVIDDVTHDLMKLTPEAIVNLGVAMVPEGRRLFPLLTVKENLLLGASRAHARAHVEDTMEYCFEVFPKLRERASQRAGSMSGGEQQMVALARALMSMPKILLIDEPSVGLAPIIVKQMIEKIGELKIQKGLTVLMAEQNFTQAMRIADRGYVIVHGEIKIEGSATELASNDIVRKLYMGV
jgi:branched-chain amino acid transport system ATP-binding protein